MRKTILLAAALAAGGCSRDTVVHPVETPNDVGPKVAVAPDPVAKPPAPPPPATDVAKVVAGNGDFARDLYRQVSQKPGNLFFSPASISTALAMTYAGARGDTAKQMETTLHFPFVDEKLHAGYGQLLADLQATDAKGPEFRVANRLFGQRSYRFEPAFLDLEAQRYAAPLELVDFAAKTEEARRTINDWVSVQTHDKIPDLIAEGVLDVDTRLVLANAVYFKGAWLDQFDKTQTTDAPFATSAGAKKVPTMHQSLDARYFETGDAQMIELPYRSGDPDRVFSMTIVLPKAGIDLAQIEAQLDKLDTWSASMSFSRVDLSLPRFKTTTRLDLGDALSTMGMPLAFDPTAANFSGMNDKERLWISHVVHQAFISLDENGTEAAAATAVVIDGEAAVMPPPKSYVLNVDHPFSVVIRDQKTGSLLFMGRIVDPVS